MSSELVADHLSIHVVPLNKSPGKSTPTSVSPASIESPKPPKKTSEVTPRIKRPMNAFMVWSQIRRQEISSTGGKFHNSDISKMLGAEWRKMADEEKLPFVQKARELREEHFREHPDYVYRPRRRKRAVKTASTESTNSSTDEFPVDASNLLPSLLLNQIIYQHLINQLSQQQQQPTTVPQNVTTNTNVPTNQQPSLSL
ncbi:unnamed protein product [Caenorhabditis bovis]|uniref:Sex-determining region Y protein n=1 Tax=Caenorhabditis bovis TaxID=2654633 RepID=A0A8S1EEG2_9PELO|nr:unnamed protein product [Caenorhabditis bovis]